MPATVKSRETDALEVAGMSSTDAPVGCESKLTVCATLWKFHVTVAVPPLRTTVTLFGENTSPVVAATDAVLEGTITVSVWVPECVTLPETIVPVIVEDPAATPVAIPVEGSMVAFVGSLDVHEAAGRPLITAPVWSFPVAVIACVLPTKMVGVMGVTTTDVKTGVGPVVLLLLPPHAIIVATTLQAAMVRTTRPSMA